MQLAHLYNRAGFVWWCKDSLVYMELHTVMLLACAGKTCVDHLLQGEAKQMRVRLSRSASEGGKSAHGKSSMRDPDGISKSGVWLQVGEWKLQDKGHDHFCC